MSFYAAVLVCAIGHFAEYAIKRKAGFFMPMPFSWSVLGLWAAYLLVA